MSRVLPDFDPPSDLLVNLYRRMIPEEKVALAVRMSDEHRLQWLHSLRRRFPSASEEEFRMIVLGRMIERGEEERQIAARSAKRNQYRAEVDNMLAPIANPDDPSMYFAGC